MFTSVFKFKISFENVEIKVRIKIEFCWSKHILYINYVPINKCFHVKRKANSLVILIN